VVVKCYTEILRLLQFRMFWKLQVYCMLKVKAIIQDIKLVSLRGKAFWLHVIGWKFIKFNFHGSLKVLGYLEAMVSPHLQDLYKMNFLQVSEWLQSDLDRWSSWLHGSIISLRRNSLPKSYLFQIFVSYFLAGGFSLLF